MAPSKQDEALRHWDNKKPIPMWLDCDTGHDDAYAILLATSSPSIHLLGVSTVYGNAPLTETTYNTRAILSAIHREDVPVYPGASKPFCRAPAFAPDIHGESGLDGTTCLPAPTVPPRDDKTAVQAMFDALCSQPAGSAWLVATGALTNVALLFATHPSIVDDIAGLSIMGGAIGGGFTSAPLGTVKGEGERFGNHTPWAEFNIYIDPESAQSIFMNATLAAKTTLIPLDLTHLFLGTKAVQRGLLHGFDSQAEGEPTSVRKLFVEILRFFAKTYADVFGLEDGPPLHDPLAVAVCFAPELFDNRGGERFHVDVVIDGEHGVDKMIRKGSSQCGRTKIVQLPVGQAGVRIPRGLNADVVWRMLELSLAAAETRPTMG